MKELTVEEKAQRYDEAIEKFGVILNLDTVKESGTIFADDVRKILPELEESRDEKIRKWLIEMVEELRKANPTNADHNGICSEAKDWLEKYGEKKSYWKPTKEQYEALDYAYNSCSDTERGNYYEGVLESLIEDLHKLENQQDNNEDSNILQRFSFYSYKDEPNILYLSGLYVNEEHRNKGIGTKILEVANEVAKSLNCPTIRLKTKKDSDAERLYRTHRYNNLATEEKDEIWLEKEGDKDKLIKELGEYKVKYTQEVLGKYMNSKDDERLRKTTIAFLKEFADKGYENAVECIDWVEKQGDHANFRNKIQVGDKVTRNKDGVLVNLSQLDRVAKKPEPEKKNPWSSKDEEIVRALVSMCTEWLVEKSFTPSENKNIETIKTWLNELKERVYPPREKDLFDEDEDKQHLINLLTILEDHGYREADVLNRIKKQDWSEIDERILKEVITLLKMFKKEPSEKLRKEYQKEIDWLNLKISKLGGLLK